MAYIAIKMLEEAGSAIADEIRREIAKLRRVKVAQLTNN